MLSRLFLAASTSAFFCTQTVAHFLDQKCSPGFGLISGLHVTNLQYDVPAQLFIDRTKNWFDYTWCLGVNITKTTGEENIVGATRTGFWPAVLGGHPFAGEELVDYDIGPDYLDMGWKWVVQPEPDIFPIGDKAVKLGEYYQKLQISSICEGRATQIHFMSQSCSDYPDIMYNVVENTDMMMYGQMAAEFGANVFGGSCRQWTERVADQEETAEAGRAQDEL